jgi:hypothetical protein
MEETRTDNPPPSDGPAGLGGWLILPMLGLFAMPLSGLAQLADYPDVTEFWSLLTMVQAAFVIAELAVNVILFLIAPVVLLFFMFKRWEIFPGWYMIWAAAIPVILIADALLGYAAFPASFANPGSEVFDKETLGGIIRSVVGAAIWIPYMMQSERVANTFVK